MAKVQEYVTDILEEILVQEAEAPIESDDAKAVIRFLNDRMTLWAANGINLGYTKVSQLDDEITVPDGAAMGIKAQVAIDIAPKYDKEITLSTVQKAKDGLKAILNLGRSVSRAMSYPSTLPIGSGSSYDYTDERFYPDQENTILTETGGSIALENDTEEAS